MKSIWSTLHDNVKDRRYAVLFFAPLAVLACLAIVGGIAEDLGAFEHIAAWLPWAGGLAAAWALVWVARAIRRARKRRREGWERKELSSDEMRAARSKLMRDGNHKNA